MEYIVIYLISVIASISIELIGELSLIKELAQKGYKLDIKKTSQNISEKERKNNIIKKLIPAYNIIYSFKQLIKYEKQKKTLLEKPNETVIEMNQIEKQIFENQPKAITALNLATTQIDETDYRMPKGFIRISNGVYRDENNDGTYTQIKFRREEDKIVVTSIEGLITQLEPKAQEKEIRRIFKTLYNMNTKIEEQSEITKQKEALIKHRNEILSQENELKLTLK